IYGKQGSYLMQHPYWIQNRMNRLSKKQCYMLNLSLSYEILDWLSVVGRLRVATSSYLITRELYAGTNENFAGPLGGYSEDSQKDRSFYGDVMVNVDYRFTDKLSVKANVGASIDDKRFHQVGGTGNLKTSANEFVYNNIDFTNKYRPISGGWNEQVQSLFASVELGWDSMLYLTATGRNEWPSQLAFSDHSSYFYPSVGMSAVVTNMFDAPKWLSFLKVRGSYSKVATPFGRYLSHPGSEFNSEQYTWNSPTTYPLRNMKPETTKSWEAGIDGRFFGGKISLKATFYHSNTFNQTIYATLPSSSGYENMIVQAGNIENKGLELIVGYRNRWQDFGWSTSYTFTTNRNRIKDLGAGIVNPYTGEVLTHTFIEKSWLGSANVAPQVRLVEGGSMSDIYVNHQIKRDNEGYVDMTTGNIQMETTDFIRVGQLSPKSTMAWSNNFSYAGFDLGVVISARLGGVVYSATQGALDYFGVSKTSAIARDRGGIPVNFGTIDAQRYYQTISTPWAVTVDTTSMMRQTYGCRSSV
ncbi:MAG: TonB-dependent receptor, partial [Alistipes sp.]|nr:TonB-dependent receptor [Alistipes sp.]